MSWFRQLYGQIILGLILGAIYGVIASALGWGELTSRWIAPFGIIFVNLLKLIAVPLILASLTLGVASLSDLRKLSQIGGHTIFIYILTTLVAITLGLAIVNLTKPGHRVPPEMRNRLQATYQQDMATRTEAAEQTKHRTPLQPLIDMVPSNIFAAASANRNMLQVVFVALLFGVGLIQISAQKAGPVIALLEGLNLLVIRLVDLIMLMAPLGVFALIADTITSVATDSPAQALELLGALGYYCLAVVFGLAAHTLITYPLLLKMFTKMPIRTFFSGIAPAQFGWLLHQLKRSHTSGDDGTLRRKAWHTGRNFFFRSSPGGYHKHGWDGFVSVGCCRLYRPGSGTGTGLFRTGDHHTNRASRVNRICSRTRCRYHHACHHTGSDQCPQRGYRAYPRSGSHPGHVENCY